MQHALDALLDRALHLHQPRGHDLAAELFKHPRPQDDVDDAGLVFQGDEDGVALAGTLTHQDHSGDPHQGAAAFRLGLGAGQEAFGGEDGPQDGHGMRLQRAVRLTEPS